MTKPNLEKRLFYSLIHLNIMWGQTQEITFLHRLKRNYKNIYFKQHKLNIEEGLFFYLSLMFVCEKNMKRYS